LRGERKGASRERELIDGNDKTSENSAFMYWSSLSRIGERRRPWKGSVGEVVLRVGLARSPRPRASGIRTSMASPRLGTRPVTTPTPSAARPRSCSRCRRRTQTSGFGAGSLSQRDARG
jgi:hypothetical protein